MICHGHRQKAKSVWVEGLFRFCYIYPGKERRVYDKRNSGRLLGTNTYWLVGNML